MESLVNQLQSLKLDGVMSEALGQPNSARSSSVASSGPNSSRDSFLERQAKQKAKEQASALRREEDRRQAVAAALERLREDRMKRGTDAAGIKRKEKESQVRFCFCFFFFFLSIYLSLSFF
jgi:hypothetical protein